MTGNVKIHELHTETPEVFQKRLMLKLTILLQEMKENMTEMYNSYIIII